MLKKIIVPIIAASVSLVAGVLIGRALFQGSGTEVIPKKPERQEVSELRHRGGFKYINPLLECDMGNPALSSSVKNLESHLKSYVAQLKKDGQASHVSVYYRDLNNGPWTGMDVNTAFSPASLLKVPVMIAALKKAERSPGILQKQFKFDASVPNDNVDPNILDEQIQFGKSYTYLNLIERMIDNSDNNAKNILVSIIGDDEIFKCWEDLGIAVPTDQTPEDFLSVKDYSTFFRILYNATYLNREMSELALKILSNATFDWGIMGGIPKGTLLANKFGERGFMDSNQKQLHDCGIIYAPNSPYLLCIMTRGQDWDTQAAIIAEISRMVYDAHTAARN